MFDYVVSRGKRSFHVSVTGSFRHGSDITHSIIGSRAGDLDSMQLASVHGHRMHARVQSQRIEDNLKIIV